MQIGSVVSPPLPSTSCFTKSNGSKMSHAITAWALEGTSVYTSEFNSRPTTQNDYKNVWICPALCNHKGMS